MSLVKSLIETQEFATLPPVAAKILQLLENDDIDFRDLSQVIEADAPLTLKLIRVANSPIYATRQKINTIQQAIITLGINRLTNIVLGVSIFSRFLMSSQKFAAEIMERFWWHSSCTGIVAKSITNKLKKNFREYEFIGGLLHDIGKLAMLQYDAVKYSKVLNNVHANGMMDVDAERELFGIDHTEVGAEICLMWKLPEPLAEAISYHTHPSKAIANKELVAIVRLADVLCEMWGADISEGFDSINIEEQEAWLILKDFYPEMNELDLESFTFELETEFRKSEEFLKAIMGE